MINIPGEVFAADGRELFTLDTIWGDRYAEPMVAKVTVEDGIATLDANLVLDGREVKGVHLDGAGHMLIAHDRRYNYSYAPVGADEEAEKGALRLLTLLTTDDLNKAGEVTLDPWASFLGAEAGRALFSVPGGVLIMNTEDAKLPYNQSYFAMNRAYSRLQLSDDSFVIAAGHDGIYRFDLSTSNLPSR